MMEKGAKVSKLSAKSEQANHDVVKFKIAMQGLDTTFRMHVKIVAEK